MVSVPKALLSHFRLLRCVIADTRYQGTRSRRQSARNILGPANPRGKPPSQGYISNAQPLSSRE